MRYQSALYRGASAVLACGATLLLSQAASAQTQKRVLVLYDTQGFSGPNGLLYNLHLRNLLGHFDVAITSEPMSAYKAKQLSYFDATFYVGPSFGSNFSDVFKADFFSNTRPFAYLGYNLEYLAWTPDYFYNAQFESKFGLRFKKYSSTRFSKVLYKGKILKRSALNDEFAEVEVVDSAKATVLSTAKNPSSTKEMPFAVKASNLWFFSDIPVANVDYDDRMLVFADLMHDILGENHAENHQAMIRIEDVSPAVPPATIKSIADACFAQSVPFQIMVVPEYLDSLGAYNGGVPLSISILKSPAFVDALKYAQSKGGQIVQHGLTHQYSNVANPYRGVSSEDYEFFRVTLDTDGNQIFEGPVAEDSAAWALGRITTGRKEMLQVGLVPIGWNTPHYTASEVDYQQFARVYKIFYDRPVPIAPDANGNPYYDQQLVPFVIKRDIYGVKRIPETIGFVNPSGYAGDAVAYPADLVARASNVMVVRDGWAGGYFHWFLPVQYLKNVIKGIKGLGYNYPVIGPGSS